MKNIEDFKYYVKRIDKNFSDCKVLLKALDGKEVCYLKNPQFAIDLIEEFNLPINVDIIDKIGGIYTVFTLKEKQKYLVPKVSFIGCIECEVRDRTYEEWEKRTLLGITPHKDYIYACTTGHYDYCRVKAFTPDNPPPQGTRFKCFDSNFKGFKRYEELTNNNKFITENGNEYSFNEVEWIDFEEYKED